MRAGTADRNRIHVRRPLCHPIPSPCSSSTFISAPSLPSPVYFLPTPGSDFLNFLLWIDRMHMNKVGLKRGNWECAAYRAGQQYSVASDFFFCYDQCKELQFEIQ